MKLRIIHNQSDINILVVAPKINSSYIISGDGLKKNSVTIGAPHNDYAEGSAFAVVHGQRYIFGDWTDYRKVKFLKILKETDFILRIALLECCSFTELSSRLVNGFGYGSSAIEIDNGNKGIDFFFRSF